MFKCKNSLLLHRRSHLRLFGVTTSEHSKPRDSKANAKISKKDQIRGDAQPTYSNISNNNNNTSPNDTYTFVNDYESWNNLTDLQVSVKRKIHRSIGNKRHARYDENSTPLTTTANAMDNAPVALGSIIDKLSPEEALYYAEVYGSGDSADVTRSLDRLRSDHFYKARFEPPSKFTFLPPLAPRVLPASAPPASQASAAGASTDEPYTSSSTTAVEEEEGANTPPKNVTLPFGTKVLMFYDEVKNHLDSIQNGGADSFSLPGTIVRVNDNGTYTLLIETDAIEMSVAAENIMVRRAPSPPPGHAEVEGEEEEYFITRQLRSHKFLAVLDWIGPAVVRDDRDRAAVAFILYSRGWRLDRLYLLEKSDIDPFGFVPFGDRERILGKALWEREHHGVIRLLYSERLKDRDWRYFISKYKGTFSCITGMCVVGYVFFANMRAYRSQQRHHQLSIAVQAIVNAGRAPEKGGTSADASKEPDTVYVRREKEEAVIEDILSAMNLSHPRVIAFTGFDGCGKTSIIHHIVHQLELPAIFVDVSGKEDTLRCIVKALGVQNIDVCGDLLDFVAEAMRHAATIKNDHVPILSIKLRQGCELERVYREAVGLASERHACHILFEVPLTFLTPKNMSLARLDFFMVPNFNRAQAFEYLQHDINPLDLHVFIDMMGTNSNDLDDFYAAVRQRGVEPITYINRQLGKAFRRLQLALSGDNAVLQKALVRLASVSFENGLANDTVEDFNVLNSTRLKDIVLYDPIQDRFLFTQKAFHTAARCMRFNETSYTAARRKQRKSSYA